MPVEFPVEYKEYNILSRGEDTPEKFPEAKKTISLSVQRRRKDHPWYQQQPGYVEDTSEIPIQTAEVTPEFVERLNHYGYVKGKATVEEPEPMPCAATYETNVSYPAETPIGYLTIYKYKKRET